MSRSIASINLNVLQDQSENKILSVQLSENQFATVQYEREGNVYHLLHAVVPKNLQGHGYGHILAQKTFDYIAANNLRMNISCSFLKSYYNKNADKYKQCNL